MMRRAAWYIKKKRLQDDPAIEALLRQLEEGGVQTYNICEGLREGTDMLLSFGGDGTFLTASRLVYSAGVPILGVNLGRLGFLSDAVLSSVAGDLLSGRYKVVEREMLRLEAPVRGIYPYALNEIAIRRGGAGTLGIELSVDDEPLPTYWADGLLVSTSTGSTAYSLSAGGPICTPDLGVFIITPIAPHNLNVRPLVVSQHSRISIQPKDRKHQSALLSVDNLDYTLPDESALGVSLSPIPLRRIVLSSSGGFISALRSKLLWGEDVRNQDK